MCPFFFNSVKVMSCRVIGRAANWLIICNFLFVKIRLSIFPFEVWDKLSVLIRSVPEVSLLL